MLRRTLAISCLLAGLAPAAAMAARGDDLALALQHRPRLLFDSAERWRPIDVDRFLAEPGHAACAPGPVCAPLASAAQLGAPVDRLDLRGIRADGADATAPDLATCERSLPTLRDCDRGGRSTIYAHVVRRGRRTAIDYWWFLRYNAYSLDRHEGDWEGVTVVLDAAGAVAAVHFAAHAAVWRYDAEVPRIVDGRVKVYVARGSHASYPRPCARFCRQTDGTLPEARFDGARSWVGNAAAVCRRRCVRLLPDGAWNAWRGRWGIARAAAFEAPRTPFQQRRFQAPFTARHSGRHAF